MRILITGATGCIGRHCVEVMRGRGHEITAVGGKRLPGDIAVTWHAIDLSAPGVIPQLMADVRPTHLLHLAWYTAPKAYWTAPENLQWVAISLELLREFAAHGGKRAVMAGSCAEYEWTHSDYSEQSTPCRPSTLYGVCKHGLNTIAGFYAARTGLSYGWARIFFLYGPYENPARPVPIDFGALPAPAGEPPVIRADNRRLVQEVGWHPRYDLDSGLDQTIEWWRHHGQKRTTGLFTS